MFEDLVQNSQVFFLVYARVSGLLRIAPLLSSTAIPGAARNGLALFASFLVFPMVLDMGYPIPPNGLQFAFLVLGEALVGIILGFFLLVVFSTFQLSAQFFSLQMGFGASEVFDPLSQVEIPVMGQFLNMIAMYIFITVSGFGKIFMTGIFRSFQAMRAVDLVIHRDYLFTLFFSSVGRLFEQALVISFPILGTLFLIQVTMGLLAKAAPQINLLILGFPISIGVAFIIILMTLPFIAEAFAGIIDQAFEQTLVFLDRVWRTRI